MKKFTIPVSDKIVLFKPIKRRLTVSIVANDAVISIETLRYKYNGRGEALTKDASWEMDPGLEEQIIIEKNALPELINILIRINKTFPLM